MLASSFFSVTSLKRVAVEEFVSGFLYLSFLILSLVYTSNQWYEYLRVYYTIR